MPSHFDEHFAAVFDAEYRRLFRYLDRLSGEPDLAADLVQEAFIRLHRRGAMPEHPGRWLVTVALNLFRNLRSMDTRRARLLSRAGADLPGSSPGIAGRIDEGQTAEAVRAALLHLPQRDRELLLLKAEGYSYRDMAAALSLHEASVGTLLARAKRAFCEAYENGPDAS